MLVVFLISRLNKMDESLSRVISWSVILLILLLIPSIGAWENNLLKEGKEIQEIKSNLQEVNELQYDENNSLVTSKNIETATIPISEYARNLISYEDAMLVDKPTLLVFYMDWCDWCKKLAPSIPILKEKFDGKLNIVMINGEDARYEDVVKSYEINGYPTLLLADLKQGLYHKIKVDYYYDNSHNNYDINRLKAYINDYLNKSESFNKKKLKSIETKKVVKEYPTITKENKTVQNSRPAPSEYAQNLISYEEAMKSDKPAMVFFYVDWCGWCKKLASSVPILKEKYYGKLNIVMINCEDKKYEDLVKSYGVNGYPSLFLADFKKETSEYIEDASNYYNIDKMENIIDSYLRKRN